MRPITLPHQPPVRCLTGAAEILADGLRVTASVAVDSPGADGGVVRPGWLIEVAAQACAACAGVGSDGVVRTGVLAGLKTWSWSGTVAIDAIMLVTVQRGASLGALSEYQCRITVGDRPIAAGTLVVALQ